MSRLLLALLLLVGVATRASAQPTVPAVEATGTAPWSRGVSDAQKARAQAQLEAGNALFLEQAYQAALEQYLAALREWDHPAIRFNMVRALINLGRPVEAYDNLLRAVAYGPAALTPSVYSEALSYRALLEGQIATVHAQCAQQGVRVTLDGELLLTCPGQIKRHVRPGSHQLVASRPGFLTSPRDVLILPGKAAHASVALVRLADAEVERRPVAAWVPWSLVATGTALGVSGWYYFQRSREHIELYDDWIAEVCADRSCSPEELGDKAGLESTARRERAISIAAFTVGGAAVVTGLVGVWLNRPRREERPGARSGAFSISPEPGGGLLQLAIPF